MVAEPHKRLSKPEPVNVDVRVLFMIRDARGLDTFAKVFLYTVASRGRMFTSSETAAEDMGLSRRKFFMVRDDLAERGLIDVRSNPGFASVYTINETNLTRACTSCTPTDVCGVCTSCTPKPEKSIGCALGAQGGVHVAHTKGTIEGNKKKKALTRPIATPVRTRRPRTPTPTRGARPRVGKVSTKREIVDFIRLQEKVTEDEVKEHLASLGKERSSDRVFDMLYDLELNEQITSVREDGQVIYRS